MKNKLQYTVYLVIQSGTGDLKIGVSSDPGKRLQTLQTGSSTHLTMEDILNYTDKKEAYAFEKLLHNTFTSIRKRGEWFDNILLNVLADCLYSAEVSETLLSYTKIDRKLMEEVRNYYQTQS